MTTRSLHLVGSIPADDAGTAMREALTRFGPHLRSVPDGETGERRNWINHIIESFRSHPDLQVATEGDWSDYNRIVRFRVRKGHTLRGDSLDFGHVADVAKNQPIFQRLRVELGHPHLVFQVGIPGDLDMALFTLGPLGAFRHRRAFTEATVREIGQIAALTAGEVLFQIEIPAELIFMASAPPPVRRAAAGLLAGGIARLAERSPDGTRFGVHLCLGDLNHKAMARLRDTWPLVLLANAVAKRWPVGRSLEYVHAPFAAGEQPPCLDPAFYRSLRTLALPETTRFVAGLLHEGQGLDEQRRVLAMVEDQVGRPVDLGAACGLGRRTPEQAAAAMDQAGSLIGT
ncbi:MAG: hypothetical protein ACRDRX_00785 [Pseudonocardiaceae bacterium]